MTPTHRYEKKIRSYGGIHLHRRIARWAHRLQRTRLVHSRTRVKTLTQDTIIANSRFFGGDVNKVPKTALTVGVATIMDARTVLIIVSGHNKARALQQAVEGGVNHMWTVSCLQLHPQGIIVADEAATVEMKVGTVNYFKDIEKNNLDPRKILQG